MNKVWKYFKAASIINICKAFRQYLEKVLDNNRGCTDAQMQVDMSALILQKIKSLAPLVLVLDLAEVRHGECIRSIRSPGKLVSHYQEKGRR